jgi:methylated-DNA-[protein]-cysteine S-methyltransferase
VSEAYVSDEFSSPIGALFMVADSGGALCMLEFKDQAERWRPLLARRFADAPVVAKSGAFGIAKAMERYFDGNMAAIDALRVHAKGTQFQCAVWAALRKISAGTTTTYGTLAKKLGRPAAMRAVGHANGTNPIAIVVPCHRVVGSDGSLTGYGGGLERKRWLLEHEARHAPRNLLQKARHA